MEKQVKIVVKDAAKSFKNQEVLKGISVEFTPGHIYGIVGYNGSGKTVFLKCICGLLTLDTGEILVNDRKMKKDMDMIQDAGIIIEEPAFLKNYSGYRNLEFLYMIRNKNDKKYIKDILDKLGLDSSSHKKVGHYSLGMKQRLAIAQAIMEDPAVLILDEPMNGLDKKGVAEIRKLFLEKKAEGKTILLASHNREDIDILCDEVYELDEGLLIREHLQ